ncbi:regulator of (H+)-ATPase in vacuolar membrane [Blastocladiella emersonii ATCC 22665]|nr:regulator of (H+)-ATPase in vacuolar membrane [Blastocladiella emersonii ATCC 22665]
MSQRVHYGLSRAACVSVFHHHASAKSYVAFATSDAVQVFDLTPAFAHVQTLTLPPSLESYAASGPPTMTALAGEPGTGRIAVAFSNARLVIYAIPPPPSYMNAALADTPVSWSVTHELQQREPPTAIAWTPAADGLVVGSRTRLDVLPGPDFRSAAWGVKCAAPVELVAVSPDGKCLATAARDDRVVKVWTCADDSLIAHAKLRRHSFYYLPHPRAVTAMSWQGSKDLQTLLTTARDGVARVWSFSASLKAFHLKAAIDPRTVHVCPGQDVSSFAWLGVDRIAPRPAAPVFLANQSTASTKTALATDPQLADLVHQYDDLVLSGQPDGTVLVWGIANLLRHAGETRVHLVKIVPGAVRKSDAAAFRNLQIAQFAFDASPEHLLMLGTPDEGGQLACFAANAGSVIYRPNTKISLVRAWSGHTRMAPTPRVYSVGLAARQLVTQVDGEVLVWDPAKCRIGIRQLNGLPLARRIALPAPPRWFFPTPAGDVVVFDERVECAGHSASLLAPAIAAVACSAAGESGDRLSVATADSLTVYALPSLDVVAEATSRCDLATFVDWAEGVYPSPPFHLVQLRRSTVTLIDAAGRTVHSEDISVPLTADGAQVLQLSAANHTLAIRTSAAVHLFSFALLHHAVTHEHTLPATASSAALFPLPTGAGAVLATARDHVVAVYAHQPASNALDLAAAGTWAELAPAHALDGFVDAVAWSAQGDVVAMVGNRLVALDPVPTFVERALDAHVAPADAACVMREWLQWNRPDAVRRILNHKYYAVKHGEATAPHVPWSAIEACALGGAKGADGAGGGGAASLGDELDALFAAGGESDGAGDMDLIDTKTFNSEKAKALREWLVAHGTERDKYTIAILDAVSEPESASMGENGQRFRWDLLLYVHCTRLGLPAAPLPAESVAFAFFSDEQPALVEYIAGACTLTWDDAAKLGAGWWVTHPDALRTLAEVIARNHWRKANNPHDCFLFYLALGKRKLMQTLWKQANGHPEQQVMSNFLSQEPSDKWRKAALKNAFVLLGKQRFELAACFFLLGDSPNDAVTVCLRNLADPQLALLIVKLLGNPLPPIVDLLRQSPHVNLDNPCFPIMLDWMAGSRIVNMARITSPSTLLLYQSIEAKLQSQFLTSSTATRAERRIGVCNAIAWYHARGAAYFNRVLVETLPALAAGLASGSGGGADEFGADAEGSAGGGDDFAAMFGGLGNDLPPTFGGGGGRGGLFGDDDDGLFGGRSKPMADDLFGGSGGGDTADDLFGGPSTRSTGGGGLFDNDPEPPRSTSPPAPAAAPEPTGPLVSDDEVALTRRADHLLTLWPALKSIHKVATTGLAQDLYFDDYARHALDAAYPGADLAQDLAIFDRLAWQTLAPHLDAARAKALRVDLLLALEFRVLHHLNGAHEYPPELVTAATRCLHVLASVHVPPVHGCASGANAGDAALFAGIELFPAHVVALAVVLVAHLILARPTYRALAAILRHFVHALSPAASPAAVRAMYAEVIENLGDVPSSHHHVLEYLALRTLAHDIQGFVDEHAGEIAPDTLRMLADVCLPQLTHLARRIHARVHAEPDGAIVHSPADDWLSAAQQELFEALRWNKAWLDDLRAAAPAGLGAEVAVAADAAGASRPASPPTTPFQCKVDMLFKQDAAIYSLALGPAQSTLIAGTQRAVLEIDVERAYRGCNAEATLPPAGAVGSSSGSPGTEESTRAPTPSAAAAVSTLGADLLKKVQQIPRSTSDQGQLSLTAAGGADAGVLAAYPSTGGAQVASHPALAHYVVADAVDGTTVLSLNAYGGRADVVRVAYGAAKVNRLELDAVGGRVAVADGTGEVAILGIPTLRMYSAFPCHTRATHDVVFYGSSTVFVSAGSSPGHLYETLLGNAVTFLNNVALWDTLLPSHAARVRGYHLHESGATAIAYNGNLVFSGGKKGEIHVLDMRHSRPLCSLPAHGSTVSCLAVSPPPSSHRRESAGGFGSAPILYSGSTDGTLKIWDLATASPSEVAAFKNLHTPRKFLSASLAQLPVSSLGITRIVAGDGYVVTAGADGVVKWLH